MEKDNSSNLAIKKAEKALEDDPLFRKLEEIRKEYDSRLSALTLNLPHFEGVEVRKNYFPEEIAVQVPNSPAPVVHAEDQSVGKVDPIPIFSDDTPSQESKDDALKAPVNLPSLQESSRVDEPSLPKKLKINESLASFYFPGIGILISAVIVFWAWNVYVSSSWTIKLPFVNPIGLALNGDRSKSFL